MANDVTGNIKKIKLSDGSIYSIFDNGALRLNSDHKLITGDGTVDQIIINSGLYILEVDDVPVQTDIDNVLVQDETTGEIMKRDKDYLLKDIGGVSMPAVDSTGILGFKVGK